jgi:hypothetical protein
VSKKKNEPQREHTAGPWHMTKGRHGDFVVRDEADRVVAETRPPGNLNSSGNEEANAILMAASPALFEAALAAYELLTSVSEIKPLSNPAHGKVIDDLSNALNDAEGA